MYNFGKWAAVKFVRFRNSVNRYTSLSHPPPLYDQTDPEQDGANLDDPDLDVQLLNTVMDNIRWAMDRFLVQALKGHLFAIHILFVCNNNLHIFIAFRL